MVEALLKAHLFERFLLYLTFWVTACWACSSSRPLPLSTSEGCFLHVSISSWSWEPSRKWTQFLVGMVSWDGALSCASNARLSWFLLLEEASLMLLPTLSFMVMVIITCRRRAWQREADYRPSEIPMPIVPLCSAPLFMPCLAFAYMVLLIGSGWGSSFSDLDLGWILKDKSPGGNWQQ